MNNKGGWKGESMRHGMAARGVPTLYPNPYRPRYDKSGNFMPSEGIRDWFSGVAEKFKKGIDKLRFGDEQAGKLAEERTKVQAAKQKVKDAKARQKQLKLAEKEAQQVDKVQQVSEFEEFQETKQQIRAGPPDTPEEIGPQGKAKTIMEKLASKEYQVPESEMEDVTMEMFESVDADTIIARAENTEKLINYSANQKRLIDLLDVEGKAKRDEYRTAEQQLASQIDNDRRLARANLKRQVELAKISGAPSETVKHRAKQLANDFKYEFDSKEKVVRDMRRQHKVDLSWVKDNVRKLTKSNRQIERHIKLASAGIEK